MSTLHNGLLRTMKAHYCAKDHPVRIIRPLLFVREKLTRTFAEGAGLPIITDNCPACFEEPKVESEEGKAH
jgi:tRNA 2-thiocytidine biosynthesis protein TtcA